MNYLVDTNILSETAKSAPNGKVTEWLRDHAENSYISSITLGELIYGIERLPQGLKRRRLEAWLQSALDQLEGRVLAFNSRVAQEWGRLVAEMEARGQRLPVADSQLAATARRHGLTVVTDNVDDFKGGGVKVLNPFD